jgi:heme exporter protein A
MYLGHYNGIKGDMTAMENLHLACTLSGIKVSDDLIVKALAKLGLAGREDLPTKVLSQGQKRRVALARLLVSQSPLWILDEPFTALDVRAVELLKHLISDHLKSGGMVIFTTHQEVDIDAPMVREVNLDA